MFDAWAGAVGAVGGVVIGGFAERSDDGMVYNSAAVVDGSGVLAVYRKTISGIESCDGSPAGDAPPPVVRTSLGAVGVAICYDLEFPEVTRHLALAGAELMAVPTNWPLVDRPHGERPPEVVIAMAAARVNRVPLACCDRTGTERGQRWTEGTTIIGIDGWPLAESGPGEAPATAGSTSSDRETSAWPSTTMPSPTGGRSCTEPCSGPPTRPDQPLGCAQTLGAEIRWRAAATGAAALGGAALRRTTSTRRLVSLRSRAMSLPGVIRR